MTRDLFAKPITFVVNHLVIRAVFAVPAAMNITNKIAAEGCLAGSVIA